MIDYKIYTFLSLCNTMNYRVTAERMNMTQPAVTNHIQQLENAYNCKLFIYKNRVLYKTEHAEILEKYALSADYNSQKLIQKISGDKKEVVRIGATKTIGEYIIVDSISELVKNKSIELTFIVDNTVNLLDKLRNGTLDFVFIEGFINKEEFYHQTYKVEKLVGICSINHLFADKIVEMEDLLKEKLILREKGSGTREAFENAIESYNYSIDSFDNLFQTNSIKTITKLVSENLGISFVYQSVAQNTDDISTFLIKDIDYKHEFTCVCLKNVERSRYMHQNFFNQ